MKYKVNIAIDATNLKSGGGVNHILFVLINLRKIINFQLIKFMYGEVRKFYV